MTDEKFFTRSRVEAFGYYERHWTVVERYVTIYRYSAFEEAKFVLTNLWNNNPKFKGE